LNIIKYVKEREDLKMNLSEINQYMFEAELCRNKSERLAIDDKYKRLVKNYTKPKLAKEKPPSNKENKDENSSKAQRNIIVILLLNLNIQIYIILNIINIYLLN